MALVMQDWCFKHGQTTFMNGVCGECQKEDNQIREQVKDAQREAFMELSQDDKFKYLYNRLNA